MARVAIKHSRNVGESIRGALDLLEGLPELFRNKTVAIKPNETWASPSDISACTQADTLEAVIQYVKQHRPAHIVVTGGSGAAETEEVFALTGMDKVIQKEKVEFFDHNRPPFISVTLSHGPQKEVMVNPRVLEYDVLISLAQHKVHHEATVTLTMKNIAMSFPAADYYGHPRSVQKNPNRFFEDIHGFIAGMCHRFPVDLAIIVGHPAMVGKGPIGGSTFESGLTIASRDFVAADYIGARLLGFNNVRHIEEAAGLGLGSASPDRIEVLGLSLDEAVEIFQRQQQAAGHSRYLSDTSLYSHK